MRIIGLIGRDHGHIEIVDFFELRRFGIGRTGHAGQFVVHAKIVLEGDRGQGLVFVLDPNTFFGLQGLVQSVAVTASGHQSAGKFIDNDDLALFDDIVNIPFEEGVGLKGLIDMVQQFDIFGIVEVVDFQQLLTFGNPFFGQTGRAGLLIDAVITLRTQTRDYAIDRNSTDRWIFRPDRK